MKLISLFVIGIAFLLSDNKTNTTDQILTREMIVEAFPEISDLNSKKDSSPYPTTFYKGKLNGKELSCHITIAYDIGTEANLIRSMKYIKDAKETDELDVKAFYSPRLGQYSFIKNNNMIHVSAQFSPATGIKDKALFLAKGVLKNL